MENMKKCSACGAEIAKSANACPQCGAKNKKPVYKKWWFWVIIAVVVIGVLGSGGGSKSDTPIADNQQQQDQQGDQDQAKDVASDKTKEVKEAKYIKPGMYKVGTDLAAGEYFILGTGYGEITSDSTGEFESIIANENYTNCWYISANDGEYLSFSDGKAYPVAEAPKIDLSSGKLPEGMYKVGRDVPAGEYKVSSPGDGYIEVSTTCRGDVEGIVSNDNFSGDKYITIKDGQYLTLARSELLLK